MNSPRLINRRRFVRTTAVTLAAAATSCTHRSGARLSDVSSIADPFNREMESFMRERGVPGGALAVVKDRRLVYAKGYGWADREKQIPATPTSLFRIASISKPITAVGVLKLVEEGRLSLEAKAFDIVRAEPLLKDGAKVDSRLARITVRQLLDHTAGWDRDKSFDPMFRATRIAEATGTAAPAKPDAVIRYMLGKPLDFDPGQRYAYSNFGYCVLGRIIEVITGLSYEKFMQRYVLAPAGIRRMRIGATLDGRQAKDEVRYYTKDEKLTDNIFPDGPRQATWPYGGFHLEAMDAHGGWIASALDLARFAAALDDPKASPLLKPETIHTMYTPPEPPAWRDDAGKLADAFYSGGWMVRPHAASGRANYWHSGSLPGTATLLVRRWDGLSWAVLFNQRSEDAKLPDGAIDPALHRAAAAVKEWPSYDLFPKF